MYLSEYDIEELPRIKRLNIINSVTGIKPANLIGTYSDKLIPNLAIISSVVHLGSNPALLGMVLRPQDLKKSDSYKNIINNSFYTINHVPSSLIKNAHYTSAKFSAVESEFEHCGFEHESLYEFNAPFVKESNLKIGLELVDDILIKANRTHLIIGKIKHLILPEKALDEEGNIQLEVSNSIGIGGLNSYYSLNKIDQFPYAKRDNLPKL